jgi:glutamine amidotransferase
MGVEAEDAGVPAIVVASERMDDDPDWRPLAPGELLIADGPQAQSLYPFDEPARPLLKTDLRDREASSQAPRHGDAA